MLKWTLLQNLLVVAMACSSITVTFIQKTKKFCHKSKCITIYGLFINLIIGFLFSQSFTDFSYENSLWIGLFSFLGADTIYKNLEGKLSTYTDLTGSNSNNVAPKKEESSQPSTKEDDILGEITYE